MRLNENFLNVKESYLFSEIAKKVNDYSAQNPDKKIIRLGIGDVTLPLVPAVIEALHKAVDEMGAQETFRGYGPEQGYDFLIETIIKNDFAPRGIHTIRLELDEVFVSDGAKSDVGNITDLFDKDNVVLIPDPVYPVYVDTNIMNGRKIEFLNANANNGFCPLPEGNTKADIIYLCSPNNPTGACYTKEQLKTWVDYALENDAVILYDAAYEIFVQDENLPRSIYEIDGAKRCAIEFCSLSKTAGFTGTRCGYTIVPKDLKVKVNKLKLLKIDSDVVEINKLWVRRQTTKFNGVPYIVQRGAEAVFTEEGQKQIMENINYYRANAKVIADTMDEIGIKYFGGVNSPYIWLKCPNGMKSWEFFDYLLENINVVGTPGAGFGENGEGYFRLTAFGDKDNTVEAMNRLKKLFGFEHQTEPEQEAEETKEDSE